MSTSTILAIDEVAEGQANKHVTINEAFAALEQAMNAPLAVSFSAGNVTLTEAQLTRNFLIICSQQSAARELRIPDKIQTVNQTARFIAVRNTGSYDITVLSSAAIPGTQAIVAPGVTTFLHVSGINVTSLGNIGGGLSYNVSFFLPDLMPANAEVIRYPMVDAVSFNDNFLTSKASAGTNPTVQSAFTVKRNGTTIGTITAETDGTFTFVTSGTTTETFNAGDILTIISPVTQDVTLADVAITLRGVRA